jgi:hypothetical protein
MNQSKSGSHRSVARGLVLFAIAGIGLMSASVARAKGPTLEQFTYVASAEVTFPDNGAPGCGALTCPAGHTCTVFGYSGAGTGDPGLNQATVNICIQEDQSLPLPNAGGGSCFASAGFGEIDAPKKGKSQETVSFGLLGQTCDLVGLASQTTLVQSMTLSTRSVTGTLSISSFLGNGAIGVLRIDGVVQSL